MEELLSEVEGKPLSETVPSLWQTFTRTASRYPDNISIACLGQPANLYQVGSQALEIPAYQEKPWLRWTYRDLLAAIHRLKGALERRGLKRGAPLFSFVNAGVEFPLCLWTSYAKGCCFVPLNPKNLTNLPEVTHMMELAFKVAADETAFIVAGNKATATKIDSLPVAKEAVKIIVGDASVEGWERLQDLMGVVSDDKNLAVEESPWSEAVKPSADNDNTIFFTSGTTALPKGCHWKYPAGALCLEQRLRGTGHATPDSRVCVPIPNNHGAAWYWLVPTLCQGGTAVYPGPAPGQHGDPAAALVQALHLERCTDVLVVPTMVRALAAAKLSSFSSLSSYSVPLSRQAQAEAQAEYGGGWGPLRCCISMAGSPCTPAHVDEAARGLGAESFQNAWGMTENVIIPSGPCACDCPEALVRDGHVSIGAVPDGLRLKICPPGARDPLLRGVPGELHVSSRIITGEYIGLESSDYYDMDGRRWFKTGDRARIDRDGLIFVVGRYKDMIIRGGENIAPAAIESVLGTEERLRSLDVQVVGAPDEVAGDVPVVVSRHPLEPQLFELLKETVTRRMGPDYMPVETFTLEDLGLAEWPRTIIGKLQKGEVAARVRDLVGARETSVKRRKGESLETAIREVWARSIGSDPDMLLMDRPISEFADSITIMRVRDRIKRETGHALSVASLVKAGTIRGQLGLLLDQNSQRSATTISKETREAGLSSSAAGSLKAEDIVHVNEVFEATKKTVLETIRPHGLDWSDVVEVTPAYDFLEVSSRRDEFNSWSPKWAIVFSNNFTIEQVKAAIRTSISRNPLLNSFYARHSEDQAFYVTLAQKEPLLDKLILNRGSLKSEGDVVPALRETIQPDPTRLPGPLAHFSIFYLEDTGYVGVIVKLNHILCDATSGQIFLDDLDSALGGQEPPHHTPYKTWSDSYHQFRNSPEAQRAVTWHTTRLQSLELYKSALWPRPDSKRLHDEGGLGAPGTKDTYSHAFDCPGLHALRHAHQGELSASVVAKTAYALATVRHTGQKTHALFASNEAARASVPSSTAARAHDDDDDDDDEDDTSPPGLLLPEASDVAGPCFTKALNLVALRPEERAVDLLSRMQAEQAGQTRHAAAPWRAVMESVPGGPSGASLLEEANWCSTFNWLPASAIGGGGQQQQQQQRQMSVHKNMRVEGFCVRVYNGLDTACALEAGGEEGRERMLMDLRGTGLDLEGMREFAESFEKAMRWLCDVGNRGRSVGDALEECF